MTDLNTVFQFDERDLNANRYHQLSERQMRAKQNQVRDHHAESYLMRYNYMFGTFAIGSIPVAGVILYAEVNHLRWLTGVMVFVVSMAVIVSLIMTLLDDEKPRDVRKSKGKAKREYHPVRRVQGQPQRVNVQRKDGETAYDIRIHDRTFSVTPDQWHTLDEETEYIFYYANSRILSVETVEDDAVIPSDL